MRLSCYLNARTVLFATDASDATRTLTRKLPPAGQKGDSATRNTGAQDESEPPMCGMERTEKHEPDTVRQCKKRCLPPVSPKHALITVMR